ncbi:hypothetical protein AZE42_01846 [Rhizopogon vesiculosus]|uniref:Nicotinate phosphoribosyltransferase N-terminal domain-containing protein n=1 Tax=Rhizopogon vesiculosus TaxID=180088 RepID=A0A1J8PGH7_9AGAM|nr:hypothetical protein AZE42_01846 [Rhizopogon vesiculosus]
MQQAVFEYYPTAQAVHRFVHRDKDRQFPKACIEKFKISLNSFAEVQLKQDERVWLQDKCNYFKPNYLDYLQSYRFKPEQVTICTLLAVLELIQRRSLSTLFRLPMILPWAASGLKQEGCG